MLLKAGNHTPAFCPPGLLRWVSGAAVHLTPVEATDRSLLPSGPVYWAQRSKMVRTGYMRLVCFHGPLI